MNRNYDVVRIRKNFLADYQTKAIVKVITGSGLTISEDEQLIIGWKEDKDEDGKKEKIESKKSSDGEKEKKKNE